MFCAVCGQKLDLDDNFCIRCGTPSSRERLGSSTSTVKAGTPVTSASSTMDLQARILKEQTTGYQPAPEPAPEKRPDDTPLTTSTEVASNLIGEHPVQPDDSRYQAEYPAAPAAMDPEPVEDWRELNISREQRPQVVSDAVPSATGAPRGPQPVKPKTPGEVIYDSCGTDVSEPPAAITLGPADIPTPSFGGYAAQQSKPARESYASATSAPPVAPKKNVAVSSRKQRPARPEKPRGKSRLPILEILVSILLVTGAGAAVWMLRSSMPSKTVAPVSAVDVTISPVNTEVVAGKACDFVAAVTGSDNKGVTWTVQEGETGGRFVTRAANAEGSAQSATAVYIAPNTPGTYHAVATSEADPNKFAVATVTVVRR